MQIWVGRQINSAALSRTASRPADGLTSLPSSSALGVWLRFPLADPIVGLLITLAIFAIVWQSAKAVFTRMLDGIEPGVVDEIRHAAEHVTAVRQVLDARARWLGHRLATEVNVAIGGDATLRDLSGEVARRAAHSRQLKSRASRSILPKRAAQCPGAR
jgi:divalent metal cation (Fe/Co/Zn/Cd) transporter